MTTKTHNTDRQLLTDGMGNKKLKKTAIKNNTYIWVFNLPIGDTCPYAGLCRKDCYGTKGNYLYQSNLDKYKYNWMVSQSSEFVDRICNEIKDKLVGAVRIHSIGDFYSMEYLGKWVKIAQLNPTVKFYAYTKSVKFVKDYKAQYGIPDNLIITYSYGGLQDNLIVPDTDRHTIVIGPNADMPDGYADGSNDDFMVIKNQKVALKYHGNRKWENSGFKKVKLPI